MHSQVLNSRFKTQLLVPDGNALLFKTAKHTILLKLKGG